jgi:hypothetical protein
MSDSLPTVNRSKALAIVETAAATLGVFEKDRSLLVDAVEQDLDIASQQATEGEARLGKVEQQIHAMADAIVAIAEPSAAIDGAVQAVKDKM